MKKLFISIAIFLMAIDIHAQKEFTIEGDVKALKEGTIINLFLMDGNAGRMIASDTIGVDGKFIFKTNIEDGNIVKYSLLGMIDDIPPMSLDLYGAAGKKISVTGNDELIYTWKVNSDIEQQKDRAKFIENSLAEWKEVQKLYIKASKKGFEQEERKKILKSIDSLESKIDENYIVLMKTMNRSEIWLEELSKLSRKASYLGKAFPFREDIINLYESLDKEQKKSLIGLKIEANLFPPKVVEVGDIAQDADLFDLNGEKHHLSDMRGKYILMDFWSSGCGPCIMAIPEMGEISELYKDKLEVVSLSIDRMKSWKDASAQHKMTWHNWNEMKEDGGIYAHYGVRGIPFYVIISPEGKIISKWTGYGKGLLKMKMKRWIVDTPSKVAQKSSADNIVIMDVKSENDSTKVILRVYQAPNFWVKISSDTHIKLQDGTTLKIKGADKIKLDEEHFFRDEFSEDYSLYFDKLPEGCKQFDFIESEGWVIKDVTL